MSCIKCNDTKHVRGADGQWEPCECLKTDRFARRYTDAGLPEVMTTLDVSTEVRKALEGITAGEGSVGKNYVFYLGAEKYDHMYHFIKRYIDLGINACFVPFRTLIQYELGESNFNHTDYEVLGVVLGLDPTNKTRNEVMRKVVYTRLSAGKRMLLNCCTDNLVQFAKQCGMDGNVFLKEPFVPLRVNY